MTNPRSLWTVEHVAALAPSPAQFAAADELGEVRRWQGCGFADGAVWGRYVAGRSEPYDVAADLAVATHDGIPQFQCTCPSRKRPCKHALGLVLLWLRNLVPDVAETLMPGAVRGWTDRVRAASSGAEAGPESDVAEAAESAPGDRNDEPSPPATPIPPAEPAGERDDRLARMLAGLVELSRWLEDRMRTGLADPALAQYRTWDELAARLVDAQVGSLANRVRRLAGMVGASPGWHEALLAELGVLHLLARAGRRVPDLPADLGDGVASAIGWQVRHASVLAGVPDTDVWQVLGRSDRREDRIEVRRIWLRGRQSQRWAMVLSFAAYQQSLDISLPVGTAVHADLHRFPGSGLRALVGRRDDAVATAPSPEGLSLPDAALEVGQAILAEPWTEHVAVTVAAALSNTHGRWLFTDQVGKSPLRRRRPRSRLRARRYPWRGSAHHRRVDAVGSRAAHRPSPRPTPRRRSAGRSVVRHRRLNTP